MDICLEKVSRPSPVRIHPSGHLPGVLPNVQLQSIVRIQCSASNQSHVPLDPPRTGINLLGQIFANSRKKSLKSLAVC
ncbi:hypothetical protein J6590_046978 [Homalodisca vitripennis]|nr:hypothetical protein J6590_046978 [Homalodisca vitripennis]